MTLEEFLLQRLTTDAPAAITNVLSGRIRFGIIEKGCDYPVVRITSIRSPASQRTSKAKQHTTKSATFQLDVFAESYLSALQVAQNIANHLDGHQDHADNEENIAIQLIEVTDIKPGYGNGTETHQHSIDLTILYRRA
ncbi:MAG: hypothetical protein RPR40_10095 [Bermanella sp.]|jgi:hypothetical protein